MLGKKLRLRMREILIAGNPNVGKSTLFNSLTKSSEHTGNFHGVTVEEKRKIVEFNGEKISFVDLPGIYSLNTFSFEEDVSKKFLLSSESEKIILVDANSVRKNLYLCLELIELGIDFKVYVNNNDYFLKHGNVLDEKKLSKCINREVEIINAKKIKLNENVFKFKEKGENNLKYLNKYVEIIKNKSKLSEKQIILALNGVFNNLKDDEINLIKSFLPEIIEERYKYIDEIMSQCVKIKINYIYGYSKSDKLILNPFFLIFTFLLTFLSAIYLIFFLIGPALSDLCSNLFSNIIVSSFMNVLYLSTDNVWLIEFFNSGVFASVNTVLSFLPQVCLLFVFITTLEDSGLISRLSFVLDDFLSQLGLSGKAVYILLLGLGCNTMSTMVCRNMNEKNLRIKTALINPYISCMARLPVFMVVASGFFGKVAFLIIAGLYVLGIAVALIVGFILNKTILKSKSSNLLLEFAPLKRVDIKHILQVARINAIDMFKRVFSIVLCMGVIIWILTHTMFNLHYTDNISESVLFFFANKIKFVFAPIGLNQAGIVCALIVGVMAKELILSTFAICNNTSTNSALISSLLISTSVISFSRASAVSFLIFSLLYCPCLSNLAVLRKETDKFYMWFSVVSQFTIAYMLSFLVYQLLTRGVLFALVILLVVALIMFAVFFMRKQFRLKCRGKCENCTRGNRC